MSLSAHVAVGLEKELGTTGNVSLEASHNIGSRLSASDDRGARGRGRSGASLTRKAPSAAMRIIEGGLDDARVIALLDTHVRLARAETARGSAHALDVSGLRAPDVTFWSAWDEGDDGGEIVAAVGALRRLTPAHGEVKSMHTAQALRGRGIASAMLRHIIAQAVARGMTRVSLETGSWPYFEPARALYARHGFVECGPFGEYRADPNSVFMTMELGGART